MERKKREQIQGRTNRTKPVIYPTIQLIIVIPYTKYELSILCSCGDISDEKYEEKEKWMNIRKNKQENAGSQSHDATSHYQFTYKILTVYLEKLLRNLLLKIAVVTAWRERKDNKYNKEQTGRSQLSIPQYNLSLLFCIPNMTFLSYTVVEISLMKNVEKKKNG